MEDNVKRDFQRRLSQCNRGEIIVIMYDILFAYLEEAKKQHDAGDYAGYKQAVKQGVRVVDELIGALDFAYKISNELYPLYMTCKTLLAKAIYQNDVTGITEAEKILRNLYVSFEKTAAADNSGPLMKNTQQVYAGMTYGRTSLNENCEGSYNRGFLV